MANSKTEKRVRKSKKGNTWEITYKLTKEAPEKKKAAKKKPTKKRPRKKKEASE